MTEIVQRVNEMALNETEVPRIYEPIALPLLSMKLSFNHVEDVQIAVSDM